MASNVEIYEILRTEISERAAAVIAEHLPAASDLATKTDLHAMETRLLRWVIGLFVPMLAGTWATVVAVILKL